MDRVLTNANTQHISSYIIGWMLDSPLATSESVIEVVTNVRNEKKHMGMGKAGGINVRHFECFC